MLKTIRIIVILIKRYTNINIFLNPEAVKYVLLYYFYSGVVEGKTRHSHIQISVRTPFP